MNEGKGNVVLLTIIAIATLLISVVGATFAYFTAVYSGGDDIPELKVISGSIGTVFDGGDVVTADAIFPTKPDDYGNHEPIGTKTFTITHTSNTIDGVMSKYFVTLNITKNTFQSGSLKYKLLINDESTENGVKLPEVTEMTDLPGSGPFSLGEAYFMSPTKIGDEDEAVHKYDLLFYFPDTEENQNDDQGGEFLAHIEVTAPDEPAPDEP